MSDGTPSGTLALLDFCPGPCSSRITFLGALGKAAMLVLRPEASNQPSQLVRTDGTRAGTVVLASFDGRGRPLAIRSP